MGALPRPWMDRPASRRTRPWTEHAAIGSSSHTVRSAPGRRRMVPDWMTWLGSPSGGPTAGRDPIHAHAGGPPTIIGPWAGKKSLP